MWLSHWSFPSSRNTIYFLQGSPLSYLISPFSWFASLLNLLIYRVFTLFVHVPFLFLFLYLIPPINFIFTCIIFLTRFSSSYVFPSPSLLPLLSRLIYFFLAQFLQCFVSLSLSPAGFVSLAVSYFLLIYRCCCWLQSRHVSFRFIINTGSEDEILKSSWLVRPYVLIYFPGRKITVHGTYSC